MTSVPLQSPRLKTIKGITAGPVVEDFEIVVLPNSEKGFFCCCSDQTLRIYRSDLTCIGKVSHSSEISAMCYIPEKQQVLTFDYEGCFITWIYSPEITKMHQKQNEVGHIDFQFQRLYFRLFRISKTDFFLCERNEVKKGDCNDCVRVSLSDNYFSSGSLSKELQIKTSKVDNILFSGNVGIIAKSTLYADIIYIGKSSPEYCFESYNLKKNTVLKVFRSFVEFILLELATYIYKNSERLISYHHYSLLIWNSEGKVIKKLKYGSIGLVINSITSFIISENSEFLLFGSSIGTINYMNLEDEKFNIVPIKRTFDKDINKLMFLNESKIVSCSRDKDISFVVEEIDYYIYPIEKFELKAEIDNANTSAANDIILIPEFNLVVTTSVDGTIVFIDVKTSNIISRFNHFVSIYRLLYWKETSCLLFIDDNNLINLLGIELVNGSVKISEKIDRKFKIGKYMDCVQKIIQFSESEFIFCSSSDDVNEEGRGKLKIIEISSDINIKVLYSMTEDIFGIYVSKLNSHILYFGGGMVFEGSEYSLKKYNFRTDKKETQEFLEKNEKSICGIFSFIKNDEEILIVANSSSLLYLLRNEIFFKKINFLGYPAEYFTKIKGTRNLLLVGSTMGSICFIDLDLSSSSSSSSSSSCKYINNDEVSHEARILVNDSDYFTFSEENKMLYYCCNDEEEENFTIRKYEISFKNNNMLSDIDEFERTQFSLQNYFQVFLVKCNSISSKRDLNFGKIFLLL